MARWCRPLVVNAGPATTRGAAHGPPGLTGDRAAALDAGCLRPVAPSGARSTRSRPSVTQTEILRQVIQLLQRPFGLQPLGALVPAKLSELDAVMASDLAAFAARCNLSVEMRSPQPLHEGRHADIKMSLCALVLRFRSGD